MREREREMKKLPMALMIGLLLTLTANISQATIYVGNVSYDADTDSMKRLFSEYGRVTEVVIPVDKDTGRGKGFCFIEMEAGDEEAAMSRIERTELEYKGKILRVNLANSPQKGAQSAPTSPTRRAFGSRTSPSRGQSGTYKPDDSEEVPENN